MDLLYVCAFRVCLQRRPYRLPLFYSQQIPTKTVPQCVEYYFTWKMKRRLGYKTLFIRGGKAKRVQELEELEDKVLSYSPLAALGQQRATPLPTLKIIPSFC